MIRLEVENVSKSYGALRVLEDVSLDVEPGSLSAILGPSGSGKTTLLRLIAGFERVDTGSIRLGHRVVDDGGEHFVGSDHRRVGYVPQEGGLFPHLSVRDNVAFGLRRAERRTKAVGELLEMVGLSGLERRFPHELSGGQRQRVALARALAVHPTLVLLDEPFSSLDANLRASVRRDVRRVLKEAGTTAILVTHDHDEALSLPDRVAVIEHGRIGQFGSPHDLYTQPLTPEIARGLGDTNLLHGVSEGDVVETQLGRLVLANGPIPRATPVVVLIRPEQLNLDDTDHDLPGVVVDAEYYGHDAVIRVQPTRDHTESIVVRLGRAVLLPTIGTNVHVSVVGPVIAWPAVSPQSEPVAAAELTIGT